MIAHCTGTVEMKRMEREYRNGCPGWIKFGFQWMASPRIMGAAVTIAEARDDGIKKKIRGDVRGRVSYV